MDLKVESVGGAMASLQGSINIIVGFQFESFFIQEDEPGNLNLLQIWLKGTELKLYSEAQSSYLDLIHDGNIYKNKTDWPVTVDFGALKELELKSLEEVKKRKQS